MAERQGGTESHDVQSLETQGFAVAVMKAQEKLNVMPTVGGWWTREACVPRACREAEGRTSGVKRQVLSPAS